MTSSWLPVPAARPGARPAVGRAAALRPLAALGRSRPARPVGAAPRAAEAQLERQASPASASGPAPGSSSAVQAVSAPEERVLAQDNAAGARAASGAFASASGAGVQAGGPAGPMSAAASPSGAEPAAATTELAPPVLTLQPSELTATDLGLPAQLGTVVVPLEPTSEPGARDVEPDLGAQGARAPDAGAQAQAPQGGFSLDAAVNGAALLALGAAATGALVDLPELLSGAQAAAASAGSEGALATLLAAGRALPDHMWANYSAAVLANPVLTKACISGCVYTIGDVAAQSYEGRRLHDYDRGRIVRSGLAGFIGHGPLSHFYYEALESAFAMTTIPSTAWYLPVLKVLIDQTAWGLTWNSLYYAMLGAMKFEDPRETWKMISSTWYETLSAGWRLWPFAHMVTYGLVPVEHRVLWVDTVEIAWVMILSMYGQQQQVADDTVECDDAVSDELPQIPIETVPAVPVAAPTTSAEAARARN